MEQIRRENPMIFNRGLATTRKLGFPDVIMPGRQNSGVRAGRRVGVPGMVESSAKGIFLMANWREVLLCSFRAEKRVLFHTRNATDFSSWREQGLNF